GAAVGAGVGCDVEAAWPGTPVVEPVVARLPPLRPSPAPAFSTCSAALSLLASATCGTVRVLGSQSALPMPLAVRTSPAVAVIISSPGPVGESLDLAA